MPQAGLTRIGHAPVLLAVAIFLAACVEAQGEAPQRGRPADAAARTAAPPRKAARDAGATKPSAGDDGDAQRPGGGPPRCVRVGTRSEGWGWPDGEFIRWAKCRGRTARCRFAGTAQEGWYDGNDLIARGKCGR